MRQGPNSRKGPNTSNQAETGRHEFHHGKPFRSNLARGETNGFSSAFATQGIPTDPRQQEFFGAGWGQEL
jgi:hypothetical protein